jgi:hypothetical protein
MNGVTISVAVLVVVCALALVYRMRRLKPQMAGYAAQRMCPACGLITPRSKAACMECGKAFAGPPVV